MNASTARASTPPDSKVAAVSDVGDSQPSATVVVACVSNAARAIMW
jgi:hypothetical protein